MTEGLTQKRGGAEVGRVRSQAAPMTILERCVLQLDPDDRGVSTACDAWLFDLKRGVSSGGSHWGRVRVSSAE